jgi:hypothetical protein
MAVANKACSRLVGFFRIFRHFPRFGLFLLPSRIPAHQRLTQTVRPPMVKPVHDTIREWIVEVLECHQHLLAIAVRQRAKFEGWLKFELAAIAEKHGAQSVEVETASDESNSSAKRSDLSLTFNCNRFDVELKTANSNWRMSGVRNKTRPITKNIKGIIRDAQKLSLCSGQGIVAFVLFPLPLQDNRWTEYLDRIASELGISL